MSPAALQSLRGSVASISVHKIKSHKLSVKVISVEGQEHEEDLISMKMSEMFNVPLLHKVNVQDHIYGVHLG